MTERDHQDSGKDSVAQRWGPIPRDGWLAGGILGLATLALLGCCLLAGLGVGVALLSSRGGASGPATVISQRQTKTFTVGFRPTLIIHDMAGNVNVKPGQDGKVEIQVTKSIANVPNAERILSDLHIDMSQADNSLTIEPRFPDATPSASGASPTGEGATPSVDLALSVPAATQLTVEVGTGNVALQQIAGQMRISTTTGNIQAQGAVIAGASQFTAGTGDVTLDGEMTSASLLDVQVQTGSIALMLPATIAAHLDARTQAGNVTVNGWSLSVTKVNGTGAQAVGDLRPGPTDYVTLRVGTGDITVAAR